MGEVKAKDKKALSLRGDGSLVKLDAKRKTLSPEMDLAIQLYAQGLTRQEAAARAEVNLNHFNAVLNTEVGRERLMQCWAQQEEEFKNLGHKVNEVVRLALDHEDPRVSLPAANMWLKYFQKTKVEVELTAEDVVRKLLGIEEGNE